MKAIVFNGALRLTKLPPPPIPEGWVFGQVLSAMYTPYDTSVLSEFHMEKRTVGSFGVIRIIELGVNSSGEPGKIYGVKPLCDGEALVLDLEGLMREYASVPSVCLVSIPREEVGSGEEVLGRIPLYIEFSLVSSVKKEVVNYEKVLILGCNFTSLVTSLNLLDSHDVVAACTGGSQQNYLRRLAEMGVKVIKASHLREDYFDSIIVSSGNPYYIMRSVTYAKDGGEIIFMHIAGPTIPISYSIKEGEVKLKAASFSSMRDGKEALRALTDDVLRNEVAVTKVLEEIPSLSRIYGRAVWVRPK